MGISYRPDSRVGLSRTACVRGWAAGCPRRAPRWVHVGPPSAAGRTASAPAQQKKKKYVYEEKKISV